MLNFKFPKINQVSLFSIQTILIRGFGVILTYLVTLFTTNFFAEDLVGKLNFSNNLLFVLGSICLLGSNQSIYQLSGKFGASNNIVSLRKLYSKFLIISSSIFLLLVVILKAVPRDFIMSIFDLEGFYSLLEKTIYFTFFYVLASLNFEMIRILKLIKISEFFRSVFRTVIFGVGLAIIYLIQLESKIVDVFLYSYLITALITTAIVLFSILRRPSIQHKNVNNIGLKEIFKISLPISATTICIMIMQGVDTIFIVKYLSFIELAYYSIAVKLTILISIVLTSINTVIAPEISKNYFQRNFMELRDVIYKSSKLNFILSLPFIIVFLAFPSMILSLFGETYVNARVPFIILTIGQLISTFCGSVGLILNMTDKHNHFVVILILALAISVILNFILVPKMGILGSAISNAVSLVFWNIAGLLIIYQKDKIITFFRF